MTDLPLSALRCELHRRAERSGAEHETAAFVRDVLDDTQPAALHENIGGAGLAAVYDGAAPGPTVLLRAELDALPQPEHLELLHGAARADTAHKCGHDGHMAVLVGVARGLRGAPAARGRVVLLFQPAEETGQGAARMLADPRLDELDPDWVFALHNLPGHARGAVVLRAGAFACGSRGLAFELRGATAHAAEPERGRSPAPAVAALIHDFSALPQLRAGLHEAVKVTVIHARVGEPAFGTSPGEGVVMVTLRAPAEASLDRLERECRARAEAIARAHGLEWCAELREPFPATRNDAAAVELIRTAASERSLPVVELEQPFGWSEDFGHFTARYRGALFGLGAGVDHPALHHPDYDFPDALLDPAVALFAGIIARATAAENSG